MMRVKSLILLLPLVLASCSSQNNDLIIACGMDEVFISDTGYEVPEKIWSWTADSADNLPVTMRNKFLTTSECKPVNNSSDILVTSSGGGVAVINIESKNVTFWASLPNAHSAELLPGGKLAVAASLSSMGNRINIYDLKKPGVVLCSDSLYSAHGLVWDDSKNVLWALGYDVLRRYSLAEGDSGDTSLHMEQEYSLPGRDGHDLQPAADGESLCLSTESNVWLFNTSSEEFAMHPLLGDEEGVKSVSYNSKTGRTAYMKATEGRWWGYYIRIAETDRVSYLPFEKLYKVRWLYRD
ncbi:MAG: DUF6528 family protein [Bacteroidota bacterium]